MNKDVIYIDTDDDVTAIIGKIKDAKEKIVALVPPKRAGALQSAVNLRLLERMAKNDKKQLVLITHNQALVALAASAKIPVAKNLQSKPELAEIPALIVDDADDIIDGSELPVGDHANSVKSKDGVKGVRSEAIDTTDLDIDGEPAATAVSRVAKKPKKNKIPNFDSFRKRLFLGILSGVALVALLIWMFVISPAATVVITANTTPQAVNATVKLGGAAATSYEHGIVSSLIKSQQKDVTVEFDATGQKDVGDKATATVRISKLTQQAYGVPAGTQLTSSNGTAFTTDAAVTIPASTPCFPAYCAQSVDVDVTAVQSGTSSNGISGSLTGPSSITGMFKTTSSGGSSRVVKVVSADDVDRAKGQILGQSTDAEKKALEKLFMNDEVVVDGSFVVEQGEAVSSPAVGEEVTGSKATLTIPTTYSIQAVAQNELDSYLRASIQSKIDTSKQKIYSTGIDNATLSNYQKQGDDITATVNAVGSVGPTIDEAAVKQQAKGKRYGEVQQEIESVDGVKSVDIQFSHFWVRKVPNNTDKITIEFKVEE